MSEKTEEPTPKRLRKAREDGDSGTSAFAGQTLGFLVAIAIVPSALRAVGSWGADALRHSIEAASHPLVHVDLDPPWLARTVLALTVPALLAVGVAGGAAGLVQSGGMISAKKLAPDFKRLNLFEGLKGLVAPTRLFAVGRALAAASVVSYLAYRALWDHAADIARLTGRLAEVPLFSEEVAGHLARDTAFALLALGAVDLVIVRRAWKKRLRMSKEDVKREYKESEGDPQMKAARERAHHEMLAAANSGDKIAWEDGSITTLGKPVSGRVFIFSITIRRLPYQGVLISGAQRIPILIK